MIKDALWALWGAAGWTSVERRWGAIAVALAIAPLAVTPMWQRTGPIGRAATTAPATLDHRGGPGASRVQPVGSKLASEVVRR